MIKGIDRESHTKFILVHRVDERLVESRRTWEISTIITLHYTNQDNNLILDFLA